MEAWCSCKFPIKDCEDNTIDGFEPVWGPVGSEF